MTELLIETGERITSPPEILKAVQTFYTNLYKPDSPPSCTRQIDLDDILQYTHHILTELEISTLEAQPTEKEILHIINQFATNKAPGSDGLTIEVISACWSFISTAILDYWHSLS
jgi:hypothetical protein